MIISGIWIASVVYIQPRCGVSEYYLSPIWTYHMFHSWDSHPICYYWWYILRAISVSEDSKLRQSIRHVALREPKLLDSIGIAQMEQEIQKRVLGSY